MMRGATKSRATDRQLEIAIGLLSKLSWVELREVLGVLLSTDGARKEDAVRGYLERASKYAVSKCSLSGRKVFALVDEYPREDGTERVSLASNTRYFVEKDVWINTRAPVVDLLRLAMRNNSDERLFKVYKDYDSARGHAAVSNTIGMRREGGRRVVYSALAGGYAMVGPNGYFCTMLKLCQPIYEAHSTIEGLGGIHDYRISGRKAPII